MGKIAYRRVAPDWVHPKSTRDGNKYQPLCDGTTLLAQQAEWDLWSQQWDKGLVQDTTYVTVRWIPIPPGCAEGTVVDYYGKRPDPKDYSPTWTPEQATAWQVYEEVTEGTPISPVYPDLDTMARTIAKECGHSFEAMRNKILATLEYGWWYIPVSQFEAGGPHYGKQFKEV